MPICLNLTDLDIEYLCVLRLYVTTDRYMISGMLHAFLRQFYPMRDSELMGREDAKDTYMELRNS